MKNWTADWGNNPYDNYNLILEILCDDKEVAVIKQSEYGLILKWYADPKGLAVPLDWLLKLLSDAKRDIVDPVVVAEGVVVHKWTADWGNNINDSYRLALEILCDDKHVATVKQSEQGLILKWHSDPKGLIIPADWLSKLLLNVKHEISE